MKNSKSKKTRGESGEVFDSLKAAAAGLAIPVEFLQEAKALGCPGFRGSRVYGAEVSAWLESNPTGTGDGEGSLLGLRKKFLKTQIAREEFKLEAMRGEHVLASEMRETITRMVTEIRTQFRLIEDTLPLTLQGMDIPSARIAVRKAFDRLCAKTYEPLVEFKKSKQEASHD